MTDKFLHIVCLDSPAPADYGGAIDMFYKVKALAESGKKIILHYFDYKSRPITGLEKYCYRIYSYKRIHSLKSFSFSTPYIVSSRLNKNLIDNLNSDNHPVILEGIHCTGILPYLDKKRTVVIRLHNNEHTYYTYLAATTGNFIKKLYYKWESRLLKEYQSQLFKESVFACLSESDLTTFKEIYGFTNLHFIPAFIPWSKICSFHGKGTYCLYHGNLEVSENIQAVRWLAKNVFNHIQVPFIIAGKGADLALEAALKKNQHISIVPNPSIEKVDSLIKNAHINVLPSLNKTGVKLKILHALFNGRYCITNENGINGSKLNDEVLLCNHADEWINLIPKLMNMEFDDSQKLKRSKLIEVYNNEENANKLSELL